jgi:hypothetical protein
MPIRGQAGLIRASGLTLAVQEDGARLPLHHLMALMLQVQLWFQSLRLPTGQQDSLTVYAPWLTSNRKAQNIW